MVIEGLDRNKLGGAVVFIPIYVVNGIINLNVKHSEEESRESNYSL